MRVKIVANSTGRRGQLAARFGIGLPATIVLFCSAQQTVALPLTSFRYDAQAQRHCPGDTVVWLDFRRGRYYLKGQSRYGRGLDGSFVCRNEARDSGYRRSLLGLR
ncbi:hypothetical protein [Bradyrhizobium septentrionale]|uniref:Uncharacterized protein n=1 Tax=Bradyrhizobium septentrionale TaxID=1404411 RepID=A0ABZ2P2N5_9BRAD|nr:hypothetical protein [Bradyrhizobium septentrionale]UGY17675.1 hypothetical protein HAP48_0009725 [Bradyrhizobium septentrionale]UGY26412.1 hypothetical protein HU675_0006445 [Bradyrhizobium septentrionale]